MGLGAEGCHRGRSRTRPYELHPNITLSPCTGGTLGSGPQLRDLTPLLLVLLFAESPPPPEQRGFMGPQGHIPKQGSPRRAASPATPPGCSPQPRCTSGPHATAGAGTFCLCSFVHSTAAANAETR